MKRTAILPLLLVAALASAAPIEVKLVGASHAAYVGGDALPPSTQALNHALLGASGTIPEAEQTSSTGYFLAPDGSVIARTWAELRKDPTLDFSHPTHLAQVTVATVRGRDPIGTAVVELKDLDRTQRAVLSDAATDRGRAVFSFVRVGKATATARVRGADNTTEERTMEITVAPGEPPEYTLQFDAANAANSTPAAPPTGGSPARTASASAAQPTGAGFFSNLVSVGLGLLVAGGAAFALWSYARKNPDAVKHGLQKIGADVPEPAPAAPDPVPAAPAPPEPPAQIVLDPGLADPIAIASVPIAPISVGPATGTPALVSADGSVFELPEGETIVGREAIGGLMLSHESVSRRHARLVRSGSQVSVEDLGSTNGTFLDGRRLAVSEPVTPGQSLRFGALEYALRG